MDGRCAYATLVMNSSKYVPGALVLAQSLRNVRANHPLICMVTDDVDERAIRTLRIFYDHIVLVPRLHKNCIPMQTPRQRSVYVSWINDSFTKLNCLNPSTIGNFEKVLFVDADMIFLENCDDLFDLKSPGVTFAFWSRSFVASGLRDPYGKTLKHGQIVPWQTVKDIGLGRTFVGRSSLMLLRPDQCIYDSIISTLRMNKDYGHPFCYSGFEEQLLAEAYCNHGINFTHIHTQFNYAAGKDDLAGYKPKVYHYYGDEKPWFCSRQEVTAKWPDTRVWWKLADEARFRCPSSRHYFEGKL